MGKQQMKLLLTQF